MNSPITVSVALALALAVSGFGHAAEAPSARKGQRTGAPAAAKSPKPTSAYEQGVEAYRAGRYEEALTAFQQAEKAPERDPNLDINIALTLFKLNRLDEAQQRFEALRKDLRYTALADYQLGVIAAQRKSDKDAARYFRDVRYSTDDLWLRDMASSALSSLDDRERPLATPRHLRPSLYARLGAGVDTNPELTSDVADIAQTDSGAGFADARAVTNLPLVSGDLGTTSFKADVHNRSYAGEPGVDHLSGEARLRQAWSSDRWQFGLSGHGASSRLDGEAYENLYGAEVDARRDVGAAAVTLSAETSRIQGSGDYDFLTGRRHRFGIDVATPSRPMSLRGSYELELNDRQDFETEDVFVSYSPVRHTAGFDVRLPNRARLTSEFRARWRHSDYRDANSFETDSGRASVDRRDDLMSASLLGRIKSTPHRNWIGDLRYSQNESTIGRYDYSRVLMLLGIEWLR